MALIELTEKITTSIDINEYTIGIFLDLANAFDTVNHSILLGKLYSYGIRGVPYECFKNVLNNRYQCVFVNGIQSNKLSVTCGVPQDSKLGPLLFLIYINDLNVVIVNYLKFIMFANYTNIFIRGDNLDKLTQQINCELKEVFAAVEKGCKSDF